MTAAPKIPTRWDCYSVYNEQAFANPVAPFWDIGFARGQYVCSIPSCCVDLWYVNGDYPYGLSCRNYAHWGESVEAALKIAVQKEKLGVRDADRIRAAFAMLVGVE